MRAKTIVPLWCSSTRHVRISLSISGSARIVNDAFSDTPETERLAALVCHFAGGRGHGGLSNRSGAVVRRICQCNCLPSSATSLPFALKLFPAAIAPACTIAKITAARVY